MKRFLLPILIAVIGILSLQPAPAAHKKFKTVEIKEFMNIIKDTSIVVIDVRTAAEHADGFIPGTDLNLDVLKSDFSRQTRSKIKASSKVAIYCRSGNRSKKAADILAGQGYEVIELGSGFNGWKEWEEHRK